MSNSLRSREIYMMIVQVSLNASTWKLGDLKKTKQKTKKVKHKLP